MYNELIIFIEGFYDELFINSLIRNLKIKKNTLIKCYKYSGKKPEVVSKYIKSILCTEYMDYIFVTDYDGNLNKRKETLCKYNNLENDKLYIVKYEIESWYFAGMTNNFIHKKGLKFKLNNTEIINKEKIESIIEKAGFDKMVFATELLERFSIQNAIKYNHSFELFYNAFVEQYCN